MPIYKATNVIIISHIVNTISLHELHAVSVFLRKSIQYCAHVSMYIQYNETGSNNAIQYQY